MRLHFRLARRHLLPAVILALAPVASALAQGTTEEREACTPDALKLCSDTIPDVARTTACMKRHEAELSPRCHAVLVGSDADGAPAPAARRGHPDDDERLAGRGGEGDGGRPDVRYFPPGDAPDEAGPGYDDGPRNGEPRDAGPRFADRDGPRDGDRFGRGSYGVPGPYGPADFGRDGYGREAEDGPQARRAGRHARAEIARLCAAGEIDPRTCDETQRALQRNHRD